MGIFRKKPVEKKEKPKSSPKQKKESEDEPKKILTAEGWKRKMRAKK